MLVKEAPNSNGSPTFPEQTETSCKPCSGLNSTQCKKVVHSFMRLYKNTCVVCIVFYLFVSFFFNSAYKITFIQYNDFPNSFLHGEKKSAFSRNILLCHCAGSSCGTLDEDTNSLAPGGFDYNLKLVNFKLISTINIWSIFCEIAVRWMQQYLTDH